MDLPLAADAPSRQWEDFLIPSTAEGTEWAGVRTIRAGLPLFAFRKINNAAIKDISYLTNTGQSCKEDAQIDLLHSGCNQAKTDAEAQGTTELQSSMLLLDSHRGAALLRTGKTVAMSLIDQLCQQAE